MEPLNVVRNWKVMYQIISQFPCCDQQKNTTPGV